MTLPESVSPSSVLADDPQVVLVLQLCFKCPYEEEHDPCQFLLIWFYLCQIEGYKFITFLMSSVVNLQEKNYLSPHIWLVCKCRGNKFQKTVTD